MRISDWSSDVCSSDLIGDCPARWAGSFVEAIDHLCRTIANEPGNDAENHREDRNRYGEAPTWAAGPETRFEIIRRIAEIEFFVDVVGGDAHERALRSEEPTSERQSQISISYAVCGSPGLRRIVPVFPDRTLARARWPGGWGRIVRISLGVPVRNDRRRSRQGRRASTGVQIPLW